MNKKTQRIAAAVIAIFLALAMVVPFLTYLV